MEHTTLQCLNTLGHDTELLQSIESLNMIRYDHPRTLALGAYIIASKVGFPIKDIPSPLTTVSDTLSSLTTLSSIPNPLQSQWGFMDRLIESLDYAELD